MCEKGQSTINVKFEVHIRVERHFNNAAAILRGWVLSLQESFFEKSKH